MESYINLSEDYNDLETRVIRALRITIGESKVKSKFVDAKAIKVNVFDYVELVILDEKLIFIDDRGLQYSLNSDCDLSDLIDILTKL